MCRHLFFFDTAVLPIEIPAVRMLDEKKSVAGDRETNLQDSSVGMRHTS